jgi:hypothetical protein
VPECDTPSDVKGMGWGVLEKGQCLQGNIQYYGDYKNTSYSYTDTEGSYSYENDKFLKQYEVPIYAVPFIFGPSAYSVAVLSIKRYRVTVNPFHVRASSPPTWRVNVVICGVWIVVALFVVPSTLSKYLCE